MIGITPSMGPPHPLGCRLALFLALAWAVLASGVVVAAEGTAAERATGPDRPRTIPGLGAYFHGARTFRAQSPEPFDLPAVPAAEPLPPMAPAPIETAPALAAPPLKTAPGEAGVRPGCRTCGGMGQTLAPDGRGFRSCSTCAGTGCVPGRKNCEPYEGHSLLGRFCGELYQSLCCPDPCYEPSWVPAANAAFFQDYARPRTIQRFRNDYGFDLQFPDRSEFFWARQSVQIVKKGGTKVVPVATRGPRVPSRIRSDQVYRGVGSLDYDQLSFYNEVAAGPRSSLFVEIPYRAVSPHNGLNYHSGFSDINFGTKGVIFDTELLLLTVQFKTYTPVGNATEGLGTGHVSIEPSLLGTLKLGPDTFFQGQLAQWIPLGGTPGFAGGVLHYHGSLNQVLFRVAANSPIIGTIESNGWSFQDGGYTDPRVGGAFRNASGMTYFSVGPGLRASICDSIDFGGAVAFPVSEPHWESPLLRAEFRILY